jgi:lysozyme
MTDHPKCIDISHWQDFPDFAEVRAAGVIAMIHKATEGTGYVDPNRARNIHNATAAGIRCATYHWLKPGNAAAQMRFYLDIIEPVQGERMIIDYEEDGCSLADLKEAVRALRADPRGLQITVYSGHLLKEQISGKRDAFLATTTDLWLAQYTTGTPTWPDETYPHWTLWQYSESGEVDGIYGGAVDLNRFDGSDDELLTWISPAGEAPPVPRSEPEEVSIAITAPLNTPVSITVNGWKWMPQ